VLPGMGSPPDSPGTASLYRKVVTDFVISS
jgi:hypothetical protein